MKIRIITALLAMLIAVCACSGGGGGGGGSGSGSGGTGSGWVAGQFLPAASHAAQCAIPRTGNDPTTGNPYPDIQGSVLDENNWLRSWSNDTYLWYDEIVDTDPGIYDDTLEYFALLRTAETTPSGNPKDRFHFTYGTEDWNQLSQSGVSVGYGATWAIIWPEPPREVAVAYTEPGSPADQAGLSRGSRILSIDGIDLVNDNTQSGVDTVNAALYPSSAGESYTFEVQDPGSDPYVVDLAASEVTSMPVQHVGTVSSPAGATVGYLLFNDHIATAEQGLIDAVETLAAVPGGIEDLVLDVRYNGGGFLAIASQLAYMIAGDIPTLGRTFELLEFNEKHPLNDPVTGQPIEPIPFLDETLGFSADAGQALPTLDLPRVFVLSGGSTCSASESIINGLRGAGIEVIQIGTPTCGKPYGFYPTDNCGTTYFTIQFRGVNDVGFGDYPDGFAPSGDNSATETELPGCLVADDLDHAFADPAERRLAAALYYRDNTSCPPEPVTSSKTNGLMSASGAASREPVIVKPIWLRNRHLGR